MKHCGWALTASLLLPLSVVAQQPATSTAQSAAPAVQPVSTTPGLALAQPATRVPVSADQVVDTIIEREHALIQFLASRTPVIETYLQDLSPDTKLGAIPKDDYYFLSRLDLASSVERRDYLAKQQSFRGLLLGGVDKLFRTRYQPTGFSWMIFADRQNFDRNHYDFHYVQREFLGEVKCLLFDVTPKKNAGVALFKGQIWVEDQDYNIVRFNGTYWSPKKQNSN